MSTLQYCFSFSIKESVLMFKLQNTSFFFFFVNLSYTFLASHCRHLPFQYFQLDLINISALILEFPDIFRQLSVTCVLSTINRRFIVVHLLLWSFSCCNIMHVLFIYVAKICFVYFIRCQTLLKGQLQLCVIGKHHGDNRFHA